MLRKSTMTALAALAVLGLAMTNAGAKPGGPGIGIKGPAMNPGIVKPAGGIKIIPSNPIKPGKPVHWPGLKPHWPHKHPHWHVHYRPRIWYPAPVAVAPTYIASRPGPCTCLSKEYTPQGAVLFKDRCTNEMAMNPPELPQQTGEAEPQQQTAQYQQQYVQPQPQGVQQK
jgi:hypothetical protein